MLLPTIYDIDSHTFFLWDGGQLVTNTDKLDASHAPCVFNTHEAVQRAPWMFIAGASFRNNHIIVLEDYGYAASTIDEAKEALSRITARGSNISGLVGAIHTLMEDIQYASPERVLWMAEQIPKLLDYYAATQGVGWQDHPDLIPGKLHGKVVRFDIPYEGHAYVPATLYTVGGGEPSIKEAYFTVHEDHIRVAALPEPRDYYLLVEPSRESLAWYPQRIDRKVPLYVSLQR